MKKTLNKIKIVLTSLRVIIISLPYKVMGITVRTKEDLHFQSDYWIRPVYPESLPITEWFIKIAQILLIAVIFTVWIINFIKIKKINNKALKKKKIKKTITIIYILISILIILFILKRFLYIIQ